MVVEVVKKNRWQSDDCTHSKRGALSRCHDNARALLSLYVNSEGKVSHFLVLIVSSFRQILPPSFVSPIAEMLAVEAGKVISGLSRGDGRTLNDFLPLFGSSCSHLLK